LGVHGGFVLRGGWVAFCWSSGEKWVHSVNSIGIAWGEESDLPGKRLIGSVGGGESGSFALGWERIWVRSVIFSMGSTGTGGTADAGCRLPLLLYHGWDWGIGLRLAAVLEIKEIFSESICEFTLTATARSGGESTGDFGGAGLVLGSEGSAGDRLPVDEHKKVGKEPESQTSPPYSRRATFSKSRP
jgi:hypothetical protein